jgi:hypothetical protein
MLGLSLFLFDHKEWDRLFSHNCSLKTMEEWNAEAEPNIPIGALYTTLGILCEVSMLGSISLFMLDLDHLYPFHDCHAPTGILSVFLLQIHVFAWGYRYASASRQRDR